MNEIKKNGKKWIYWFMLGVAIIAFYKLLDNFPQIMQGIGDFLKILKPFFIGILIAYILYMPSKSIEKMLKKSKIKLVKNRARGISILISYIIFALILIIIFNWIFPVLVQSVTELVTNLQGYIEGTIQKYNELPQDSILKSDAVTNTINDVLQNAKNIDFKQYINMDTIGQYAKGAMSFVNSIIDIFVAFIVSVYLLSGRTRIMAFMERFFKAVFKEKTYQNLSKYFNDTNEIFFRFLSSQLIDAVVVGVLTTIAMSIMGIKYAPLLGFIIGLFNIIPYVGAIIAVIIAGIITLITGGISQAIWMLVVIIILQQIDANVINPKIVGDNLKISPLVVILAITIGGAYFGMWGIFLSVPISAVLKILVEDFIKYKNETKIKKG